MDNAVNHVYCVDDDDAYRKSLVRLLASVGYSVKAFASGQDFLDAVPVARETGVLVLDLRMPGMDGFELQHRMNELASRLAVIMITADEQPGDRDQALNAGALGFLQKPFPEESLLDLIDRAHEKCLE